MTPGTPQMRMGREPKPLSAAGEKLVRLRHTYGQDVCSLGSVPWPCDAADLLATLDHERRMADTEVAALRDGLDKAIEAATRRETELRARIEPYTRHHEGCEWTRRGQHNDPDFVAWVEAWSAAGQPCSCGLLALLATDAGTEDVK